VTIPVLIILGALWAAVLVPPLLRARSEKKTGAIGDYAHTLGALKSSNRAINPRMRPAAGLVDPSMHRGQLNQKSMQRKRRKDILMTLGVTTIVLLILAFFTGATILWVLFFVCALALGAYCYLLFQMAEQQRMSKGPRRPHHG
jgi:Flp pilus assembly protein TadB